MEDVNHREPTGARAQFARKEQTVDHFARTLSEFRAMALEIERRHSDRQPEFGRMLRDTQCSLGESSRELEKLREATDAEAFQAALVGFLGKFTEVRDGIQCLQHLEQDF